MAFGFDAINIVRGNRNLLKKKKFKDVKKIVLKNTNKTEGTFKEVSKEELKKIKAKIRKKAKRDAIHEILIYSTITLVLVSLLAYLFYKIIYFQF